MKPCPDEALKAARNAVQCETNAETAARDAASTLLTASPFPATPEAKVYTAEEKNACSIEAMRNGGTCEACQ